MIKTKILSWILTHFFKDYSIAFQTEHTERDGILTRQKHSLIQKCLVKNHKMGIVLLGNQTNCLIESCFIISKISPWGNPFLTNLTDFYRLLDKEVGKQ